MSEYAIGVVKVWEPKGAIRPFVGGGVAAVRAILTEDAVTVELVRHDTTSAFYLDGGVFWRTGRRFNIGLGTRLMSLARMEIGGTRFDANYLQVHVLAGFGWPRREKSPAPTSPTADPGASPSPR